MRDASFVQVSSYYVRNYMSVLRLKCTLEYSIGWNINFVHADAVIGTW